MLYVGHGAVISGADTAVAQLAEKLQAPVVNTLLGKGAFDETTRCHLGMLGMHGTAYANKAVIDCDLIMAIGARCDDRITGKVSEFCTEREAHPHRHRPGRVRQDGHVATCSCSATRGRVVEDLLPLVGRLDTADWLAQCDAWRKEFPLKYSKRRRGLRAQHVLDRLNAADRGHARWSRPTSASTRCGPRSSA